MLVQADGDTQVPAEKNSDIANIDQGRNLAMKPSTGEVFDEDTGEVITVVTTTVSFGKSYSQAML